MADIPCKEPGCDVVITDPCVKLKGLFSIRTELTQRQELANLNDEPDLLESIDKILHREFGMNSNQIQGISSSKNLIALKAAPLVFTLKCIKGHINQYSITCQS